jgi:hypothetical protein
MNYFQVKTKTVLVRFTTEDRKKVLNLVENIRKQTETLQNQVEGHLLYMCTKKVMKYKGDLMELGVYKGGTAKLICEAKDDRPIYLFDPFEFTTPEFVQELLKDYQNVHIYKGFFPEAGDPVKDKNFALVHMDINSYEPTLESLKFIYPKMVKGGIILSHDYSHAAYPGIKQAFDEFFAEKPEIVLETTGSHCMVIKL